MQMDRRYLQCFEWPLAATIFGMVLVGILTIYSTNVFAASVFRKTLYLKQLTWLGLGTGAMLVACLVNPRTLARYAYLIFAATVLLLIAVFIMGKSGLGAQRWLRLGPLTIQPSEFAKLALILYLARYFDDHREELANPKVMLVPVGVSVGLALLVLKQPDLGTALLLVFLATSLMLLMGLSWRYLIPAVIGGGVLTPVIWIFLKDYQRRRILVFLNPDMDPLGASYHIAQSKIAVGSGGFLGKGWLGATQSQLNFLPLNHTDFIFAVLAEQWGFLGCLLILLAYLYLITKGFQIAQDSTDLFVSLLAAGVASMLAIQVLINMAMVMGLLPVVGIPLPLLSYGGSSLVVTMLSLGLLLNIQMRRFLY